jgi:hypothetical protein
MEAIECVYEKCGGAMLIVHKTSQWSLYKCVSCRNMKGFVDESLSESELEDVSREMDAYAEPIMGAEVNDLSNRLQQMDPDELNKLVGEWFGRPSDAAE